MALAISSALVDREREPNAAPELGSGKRFEQTLAQAATQPTRAQRTQMTVSAASAALRQAWTRVNGETPNDKTVALLTAQWAHETAHGTSMYNYNFGGIKGTGPTGLSVEQRTKEGWGRTERQITDRFRAYESAQSGAEDYVKLLTHRYPEAINAAKVGDSQGFVRGLKQRGYFTGDAQAYERSVSSIAAGILPAESRDFPATLHERNPVTTERHGPISNSSNSTIPVRNVTHVSETYAHRLITEPLVPSALVGALSNDAAFNGDIGVLGEPTSTTGVSALSMVDEVLRATLRQVTTEHNDNRHPDDVGRAI
jgi:hypothetical protein